MNTKNNKRRKASQEKIEKVFIELLQTGELSKITVSDICKLTGLNRSTFYANYIDIYDLADKIRDKLEDEVNEMYGNNAVNGCGIDYLPLFQHIRDNQSFYKTYFKLGYDSRHTIDFSLISEQNKVFPAEQLEYHVEFHKAGLNAIIKKWLNSGCVEPPEVMVKIIESEYSGRRK